MVSISNLTSVGGSLLAGCKSVVMFAVLLLHLLMATGLSDQFGRKYGLLISGLVIVAGSITLSASFRVW